MRDCSQAIPKVDDLYRVFFFYFPCGRELRVVPFIVTFGNIPFGVHQPFCQAYDEPIKPTWASCRLVFFPPVHLQSGLRQCNMALVIRLSGKISSKLRRYSANFSSLHLFFVLASLGIGTYAHRAPAEG